MSRSGDKVVSLDIHVHKFLLFLTQQQQLGLGLGLGRSAKCEKGGFILNIIAYIYL